MKNLYVIVLFVSAMMLSGVSRGQTDTLTVADGIMDVYFVPFYPAGMYMMQHNQVVYPSGMLSSMAGDSITGMAVHMSNTSNTPWGAGFIMRLGIRESDTLQSYDNTTELKQVWSGTVNGQGTMWFLFDSAFAYPGGNLLVDFQTVEPGVTGNGWFYGISKNNAAIMGYLSNGVYESSNQSYLPKTSFLHVEGEFDNCPPPQNMNAEADNVEDEIYVWWDASDAASLYEIYLNDSLVGTTMYNYYSIMGTMPNTLYKIGVRALCSGEDDVYSAMNELEITTPCDPVVSLPWTEDFEELGAVWQISYGLPDCWNLISDATGTPSVYVYNSTTANHTEGGSLGIRWAHPNVNYYGTYHYVVLPLLDVDNYPLNTLQLEFWAKAGNTNDSCRFAIGAMSDNGDISTFDTIATLMIAGPGNTEWKKYTIPFGDYMGDGKYVAIREIGGSFGYGCIDDLTIRPIPDCAPIMDLQVQAVTSGAVVATWGYQTGFDAPETYIVECSATEGGGEVMTDMVVSPYVYLNGLEHGTEYQLKVCALCSLGIAEADSVVFQTIELQCEQLASNGIYAAIGEGNWTTYYLPTSSESYSLTQQIYTKSEIGKSGKIEKLLLMCYGNYAGARTMDLYLAHDPLTSFSSFHQPSDMTKVYSGVFDFPNNEWYTIELDSAFYYDTALGNLLVCFNDVTGTYDWASGYYCHSTSSMGINSIYKGIQYYGSPFDPYTQITGTTINYRNNIILKGGDCDQWNYCVEPAIVPLEVGSDAIEVCWIPGAVETEWNVEYRLVADTEWSSVAESTSIQQMTISGLSPSTQYDIRVSYVCEGMLMADTVRVRTGCGLITVLPLFEDFEDAFNMPSNSIIIPPCWSRKANSYNTPKISAYAVYNHTSGGSVGFTMSESSSNSTRGAIILPALDTSIYPINRMEFSFWAKKDIEYYTPRLVIGAMSSATDMTTFIPFDTLVLNDNNTLWHQHTFRFTEFPSTTCDRIAILGQAITGSWGVYLDDFMLVEIPYCDQVHDVNVVSGPVSAIVTWTSYENCEGALVEYRDTLMSGWDTIVVTGQDYAILTGLEMAMPYELQITSICGEDTLSDVYKTHFTTKGLNCAVYSDSLLVMDTLGSGENESAYIPFDVMYYYSMSQQIFTAEEMGLNGKITSLFVMPETVNTVSRNVEIYLAHTQDTDFTTFIYPSDLTKVYNGLPNSFDSAWTEYVLDQPFDYNGTDNLLVCFRDMTGATGMYNTFVTHTNPHGSSIFKCIGVTAPVPLYTTLQGDLINYRNNMLFKIIPCDSLSNCAAPLGVVTDVGSSTVDVMWANGNEETMWNTYYRLSGEADWTVAGSYITNPSYQFTGLTPGYSYEFRIESICEQLLSSYLNATTECGPIGYLPFYENFNSCGTSNIPNCWSRIDMPYSLPYVNLSGSTGSSIMMYYISDALNHTTQYLTLPALDTSLYEINETELSFYAYRNNYSGSGAPAFIVGVMTDDQDVTTFTPVDTVFHTVAVDEWEEFFVPLTNYSGNGAYISIRPYTVSGSGYSGFVDDLTLNLLPPCPRADSLTAGNGSVNGVELSWVDHFEASAWQIAYGPFGASPEECTFVMAGSNPFLLGNPTCNSGVFYVRPLCDDGDTTFWSLESGTFYLKQMPASTPYNYDFENGGEWDNWQGCYNHYNHLWTRGDVVADSGSYSVYIGSNQGDIYKPYLYNDVNNAAIFRDVDFGTFDTTFLLTFRARSGGTMNTENDGLAVFFVDTAASFVPSNNDAISPWGAVESIYPLIIVSSDTNWTTYTVSLDHYSGVRRMVFFWYNRYTPSEGAFFEPAAVDNIHIDYCSCPRPTDITTTYLSTNNAILTWNGPAGATYEITYRSENGYESNVTAYTNEIFLSGLINLTVYYVRARKLCGDGDTSLWSEWYQFITIPCQDGSAALNYKVYDSQPSGTIYDAPIGGTYSRYSYTQTLIDSAYMASLGGNDINSFGFNVALLWGSNFYYYNMNVFMANVPEKDLKSGWILPNSTDHVFVQVFDSADFNFNSVGWQVYEMDTTFAWDGHSNVLVSVQCNRGDYYYDQPLFNGHVNKAVKTRYAYRNNSAFNYNNPGVEGSTSTTTADIMLFECSGLTICETPTALQISDKTSQSANVGWLGNNDFYELRYKKETDSDWGPIQITDVTSYHLESLSPNTAYVVQVRSACIFYGVDTSYSNWVETSFTTEATPCLIPVNLVPIKFSYNSVTLDWTPLGEETEWNIHLWNTSHNDTLTVSTHPYTITGLPSNTLFMVAICAKCGEGNESGYGNTIAVQTTMCLPVEGLTVSALTPTTATLVWEGDGIGYDVEYGDLHFSEGVNTQVVHVVESSCTLTGLEPESEYSVSVRAQCEENLYSFYCAQVDFTTPLTDAIEPAQSATRNPHLSIIPNPTSDATTVTISGVVGEVELMIVDLNGRVVMREEMTCTGDCEKPLQVAGLSAGAYFVRLGGGNLNIVKKLIVK